MQPATGQPPMAEPAERKQIDGEATHIGDCQVWVEIYYLDSQTDYREYLPQKRVPFRFNEFIFFFFIPRPPRADFRSILAWAMPLLFLVISWSFMYFVWESY